MAQLESTTCEIKPFKFRYSFHCLRVETLKTMYKYLQYSANVRNIKNCTSTYSIPQMFLAFSLGWLGKPCHLGSTLLLNWSIVGHPRHSLAGDNLNVQRTCKEQYRTVGSSAPSQSSFQRQLKQIHPIKIRITSCLIMSHHYQLKHRRKSDHLCWLNIASVTTMLPPTGAGCCASPTSAAKKFRSFHTLESTNIPWFRLVHSGLDGFCMAYMDFVWQNKVINSHKGLRVVCSMVVK